jgi:hypothetical protein
MNGCLATLHQPVSAGHPSGQCGERSPLRPQSLSSLKQPPEVAAGVVGASFARQPWLADALAELGDCVEEAREEGYPEPAAKALAIAEALLKRIALLAARLPQPSVYPSADNEIVLFFCRGEVQAAVSMSIEADGGGVCFSNVGGLRRARYQDARELPDAFVAGELLKLSHLVASA